MHPPARRGVAARVVLAATLLIASTAVGLPGTATGADTDAPRVPRAVGSTISGTVLGPGGEVFDEDHLPEIELFDADTFDQFELTTTDDTGAYSFDDVPDGEYVVHVFGEAPLGTPTPYREIWEETVMWYDATVIEVAGDDHPGIDFTLDELVECLPAFPPSTPAGGPFPDVTFESEPQFCSAVERIVKAGIAEGFPDGLFHPAAPVSRQAMAAFLYRYLAPPGYVPPSTPSFSDVPLGNNFYTAVEWLASTGITGGFDDGTYRPTTTITRQSVSAFLYRAAGSPSFTPPTVATFPDVPTGHQFFDEIEWMASYGITEGYPDGTFRPMGATARKAMCFYLLFWDSNWREFDN